MSAARGIRLRVAGLGFAYGRRRVLDDVGLAVEPGEVVGLIGPNGSGKSTLIHVVSGVYRGYAGTIHLDGAELRGLARRELARRVAVVPQESTFGFPFSALEVVLMGRHPHLASLALESAADLEAGRRALERCGAADLGPRPIHELSSGERQRVVFARALAQDPLLLLLDEPASFLDLRHQVALYDVVRTLAHGEGRSVLTVLHDLNLAAEYCDRLYLLRSGRVEAAGEAREVLTRSNLARVFETEVWVDTNPVTGRRMVVPLPGRVRSPASGARDGEGRAPS